MALGDAVQGAISTPQTITWQDSDGTAWDLTGGTLTGVIKPERGGAARAITGVLAFTSDGSDGEFTWARSAADLATDGTFWVQFKSTYADTDYDLTEKTKFVILPAI